ncbi:DUF3175 domain-containing protein [Cyanobium sp. CH-040]|nr:DUF3175 domain-containing protein [Cyanobium sp. CH-040]
MAMLNFYFNRAGGDLRPERRQVLEQAKLELRALYGRYSPTDARGDHRDPCWWQQVDPWPWPRWSVCRRPTA